MKRSSLPRSFDELSGLRARGLVRESTVEQGGNSGPVVQRADQEAFAARWGLALEERVDPDSGQAGPFLYTDLISGSDAAKRPSFLRMVADAKAGLFDVLLVRDTSRFARNWRQAGGYEDQLHAAGVVVAYIMEGRLSSDRAGQLQIVVNHAINEEYRLKLAENVQRGFRIKRFDDGKFSGTPPIGYVMEYEDVAIPGPKGWERRETGRLVPDKAIRELEDLDGTYTNAALVRYLGEVYASSGLGARPLAARLNREGFRTARGGMFTGNAIRHMIERPTYAGYLSWHHRKDKRGRGEQAETVAGAWEPLWPEDLWQQIQAVRARHWRGSAGGRMRNVYPLRQLAICDRCDRRLIGEAHGTVPYMACSTQRERHACEQRGVRSSILEDHVGEWMAGVRIPDDWRRDVAKLQRSIARGEDTARPVDRARIQAEMDRLRDVYVAGHLEREAYIAQRRTLETELNGAAVTSIAPLTVLERAKALLEDLAMLWQEATPTERGEICQSMFSSVRVRDQDIVSAELANPDYLPLVASAAAAKLVGLAPPDGSGRSSVAFAVEGSEGLVAALRTAALGPEHIYQHGLIGAIAAC